MTNRLVIILTVIAVVLVPCGKIAVGLDKAAAQMRAAVLAPGAAMGQDAQQIADHAGDTSPVCLKSCKTWQGIVPRVSDDGTLPVGPQIIVAVLAEQQAWPKSAEDLASLGARSPPDASGTPFARVYAVTSRFHS